MDLADIGYNSDFHGLLGIPDEILLNVISHLDRIQDIIALGEASRRLHDLTQDRSVWLQILREEAPRLPLPRHIRNALSWTRLSSQDLMSVVRRLRRVDQTWLFPRTHYFVPGHRLSCALDPVYDNDDGARSIYSLDIFLDRWLLCVYQEKLVEIWDLDSVLHDPHKPILCTSHGISGSGSFSSAITHLDEESKILTVAVSW
ncbi:hypothetical protein BD414DRAFT_57433 [Trametes punicea]|nr:hypothetical protein BD414DRAFT_57433 [Trametes punicea]